MKKAYIVLGMGYGDEGKGVAVDYLSRLSFDQRPVVIRFSGGHQASHTVIVNEKRHIFSSFGSGTMRGVPTFWSKYCTFQPQAAYNEYIDLAPKCNPISMLYVDYDCPVTTPYDMWHNRYLEDHRTQRHGSVGVGIGATFARHEETHYRLYARDLKFAIVLEEKLKGIKDYYLNLYRGNAVAQGQILSLDLTNWKAACKEDFYELASPTLIFEAFSTYIFEGSQGILLDQVLSPRHQVLYHEPKCARAAERI
jgi:adenylosuccinate synthase